MDYRSIRAGISQHQRMLAEKRHPKKPKKEYE